MSFPPPSPAHLFDAIPTPATLIDPAGAIADINQLFLDRARQHGYELVKEDWIGQPVWAFGTPNNRPRFEAFVRRALEQRDSPPFRERLVYELGRPLHVDLSISLLRGPASQVIGALVLWQNVTEEVRYELRHQIASRVRSEIWRMKSSEEMEGVLVAVRNGLAELGVSFNNCGVNLVHTSTDPPQVHSHSMTEEGVWLPASKDDPGTETVLQIWRSQQVAYRRDLDREDRYGEAGWIKSDFNQPIRSVVDVPFAHGTLAINSVDPDAFSEEDLEILQEMAQVLSEGFQRLEDFLALEQRNRQLEWEITARQQQELRQQVFQRVRDEIWRMQSTQDLGRLLTACLEGLRALGLNFTHFGVNLIDEHTAPPSASMHYITPDGEWQQSHFRGQDLPLLRVWQRQELVYRPDLEAEDLYGERAHLEKYHLRSIVDAPFSHGTLAVSSQQPEAFSARDLEILQEMAALLSQGFQRLEDLQNLERRNQELEREIAERQQAEVSLRLAQFTLEHASEAVFWFAKDGRLFFVNEAACRLLGYTREELLSLTVCDIDPDFPAAQTWPQVWERLRAKDGRVFPVEITASYLEFNGREYVCTFAHDITARKQLEEQLRQAQKMEAIGQLTAGIAHNFNNMLQGVLGNLSLALEKAPAFLKSFLEDAETSANRAAEMVRQLMVFARPASALRSQLLDLRSLLQHTLAICRQTFPQHISLQADMPPHLLPVQGHPGHLEQVLLNLLLNARDAVEEAEPPAPHIHLSAGILSLRAGDLPAGRPPGTYLRLQVRDNGVGMDARTQAHLFEPFFTTKPVGKGTGLGLATVYAIVQEHQGWVEYASQPGLGTTFTVYLPAAAAAPAPAAAALVQPGLERGEETLLVIDDEELVRQTVSRALRAAGYTVLEGRDGVEGLAVFAREPERIALVLLDLSMPGLSGAQVLERLRQLAPQVKVVLFTGYAADQGRFGTADAILQKPIHLRELARKVRQVLDS